ncbi:MAG TPA: AraC family transcriptional regulator, partial [Anseongella sp.]|nr:AraC family transcriptional regulator [Anseongella sp.]
MQKNMTLDDITLQVFPGENNYPVPVELQVTEEKDSEYMVLAIGRYGALHFRIIQLAACSIWHTRFFIHERIRLRVSAPVSCTFLWVAWKNHLYYTIRGLEEQKILADHYNLCHLPDVEWEISFRNPGEYETFNILFSDFSLEEWNNQHFFPDLGTFLDKADQGRIVFLNAKHRRLTHGLQKVVADMIRGPVGPADRQAFFEDKVLDLFFHVLRDVARGRPSPKTALRQPEIEKLCEMRDFIREHPEISYNLKQLARMAGMNETKLEAGFRQLFKTTVFRYIRAQRMQTGLRLLRESSLAVKEVAARAGYKNLSNF